MTRSRPSGPARPLSTRKRWTFRVLAVVLVLAVLEGAARVYRVVEPQEQRESYGYPPDLYVWHETHEYGLRPEFRGFFTGRLYADVPIETNADGFRDRPFAPVKRPGVKRVVFLGDSVSFGAGVAAGDRFSDALGRTDDGTAFEPLNLAVNSYNLYHYGQQTRYVVPRYDPDLVVVGFCLNDLEPRDRCWPRKHVRSPDGTFVGEYAAPPSRWRWLTDEPSALVGLYEDVRRRLKRRDGAEHWERWMGRVVVAWEDEEMLDELRRDLARLRDDVREQGSRLVVLALPERHDLEDPDRYGAPRRKLVRLLEDLGIEHLDVYPVFREQPEPDGLFLPEDSVHFSPRGHALVADVLREQLAD